MPLVFWGMSIMSILADEKGFEIIGGAEETLGRWFGNERKEEKGYITKVRLTSILHQ